jgi:hypothetical membrane protein
MDPKRVSDCVVVRLAALGPLLFLAIATVAGLVRPEYDSIAEPISALALGPSGWIQRLNFALLALSFLSFALVLRQRLSSGRAAVAGPGIFVVMAVGVALAGIFTMDPIGAPATTTGRLHGIAGFLVFPWMPVVLLVMTRRFRHDPALRPYAAYTLATAVFLLATLVFFLSFVGTPDAPPRLYSGLRGLVQRTMLAPFFVWIALIARRIQRDRGATLVADAGVGYELPSQRRSAT